MAMIWHPLYGIMDDGSNVQLKPQTVEQQSIPTDLVPVEQALQQTMQETKYKTQPIGPVPNLEERLSYNDLITQQRKLNPYEYTTTPGNIIQPQDIKVSKGYSKDASYTKGVKYGEKLVSSGKTNLPTEAIQAGVKVATEENVDPRVLVSQSAHETSKSYPNYNPGGIKPSSQVLKFLNSLPIEQQQVAREKLIQLQRSREPLDKGISGLKDYFRDARTQFLMPTKSPDIIQLTKDQVTSLNTLLETARASGKNADWKALADEVAKIKKMNPKETRTNKAGQKYQTNLYFQLPQPFMKYQNAEDGFRDMIRAQKGKTDRTSFEVQPNGSIERVRYDLGVRKIVGTYK